MFHRADGFVVAPGGFGTLEEAFEVLTAAQIGLHRKPLVFFDVGRFWRALEPFLDHAVAEGVLHRDNRALVQIVDDPGRAVALATPAR